jgi:dTMP kinase
MKFVNIEGLDGSGKSTQIKLLQQYFNDNNIAYQYLHFPRTDSPVYGELIAKFLRGDLGDMETVDPYLIALLYAGDRNDAKSIINEWLKKDYLVLIDRYVYSNIAFQCAKLNDDKKIEKLSQWIKYVEYEYFKIPKPDVEIFLDVPAHFTEKNLSKTRVGSDREYLKGKDDIHEKDINFQERVRDIYHREIEKESNFHIIKCYDKQEQIYDPETIKRKILHYIGK